MENWDPTFPHEPVLWYDEYIQREGPICVNWLEAPRMSEGGVEAIMEARGIALYSPYDGDDGIGTKLAVAPLDDGSVCLWDINGTRGRRGGILAKSQPDALYMEGFGGPSERLRSQRLDSSISDRVSIDNHNHRAYFAVQSRECTTCARKRVFHFLLTTRVDLIEVDLNRLDVVSRDSFEWSITTLSAIHPERPLMVGTSLGIHFHDFRARARATQDAPERVDGQSQQDADVFRSIFDPKPLPPYASLSQPTPTNIVYLPQSPQSGSLSLVTEDFYVSGRFSSILHYDLRKFPHIVDSIHSGAFINSMAALPYPFSAVDHEVRRLAEASAEKVEEMKSREGCSLIAGGGYKQKGSLEVYGLSSGQSAGVGGTAIKNSAMKNRFTAAPSPIFSVANHGTKIVFSDGFGNLTWFERDGITDCRRVRIGHSGSDGRRPGVDGDARFDDTARKIVSTRTKHGETRPNNDDILFWTGERLGLVSFTGAPLYGEKDFMDGKGEEDGEARARREYAERMREALERQADEVRFMGSLGLGTVGS